ncbi:MAG: glucuronate isomerase [Saccharofermentanales bacterium]
MNEFLGEDFLIENSIGFDIYKKYAKNLPIYDYHCHLSIRDIARDRVFTDVGEMMLEHDHYKWRIMRAAGIEEKFITGDSSYREKFIAYASTLEKAVGNPLFLWTNMELKEYFGINCPLTSRNAEKIYDEVNRLMSDGSFTAKNLIRKSNVCLIATTDDPADSLEYHVQNAADNNFKTKVVPTFRPDFVCNPLKEGYLEYLVRLGNSENTTISSLKNLLDILKLRMDFFGRIGCKISDHDLAGIPRVECDYAEASQIFLGILVGEMISQSQADKFLSFMLLFFAGEYRKHGWVMQLHISALRNPNTKLFLRNGPDFGLDSVGDTLSAADLCRFFNRIENTAGLPKTIVYSLNPASYYVIASAVGSFAGEIPGKLQLGAAWWFCDHRDGIREQLKVFADTGVLGMFNGMLTDSRSFVSYVRHDYFRRILCSLIGEWVENGECPDDEKIIGNLVKGICFYNAEKYFGI